MFWLMDMLLIAASGWQAGIAIILKARTTGLSSSTCYCQSWEAWWILLQSYKCSQCRGDLRSIMKDRIEKRQLHPLCHIIAHLHATDEPGADGRTGHRRIRGPGRLSILGCWPWMTSESRQSRKQEKRNTRNKDFHCPKKIIETEIWLLWATNWRTALKS